MTDEERNREENESEKQLNNFVASEKQTPYGFATLDKTANSGEGVDPNAESLVQNSAEQKVYRRTQYGFMTADDMSARSHADEVPTQQNANPYVYVGDTKAGGGADNSAGENRAGKQKARSKKKNRKTVLLVTAMLALAVFIGGFLPGALLAYNTFGTQPVVLESHNSQANVKPVVDAKTATVDWAKVTQAVKGSVVALSMQTNEGTVTGSGVIFDPKGYILTNYHVIAKAKDPRVDITVQMDGGRLYQATLVGYDSSVDLAVIKLDNPPKELSVATLGDSSNLQVGEMVLAIGNPLGLESTVTTGIISALDRAVKVSVDNSRIGGEVAVTNAIQIDASINPGNSGGPLFDSKGRVIGINSSIASIPNSEGASGSIGIGFAIPVNLAKNVAEQIIKNGKAEHVLLGVTIGDGVAKLQDGTRYLGAYVKTVVPSSPAEAVGIKQGDVIVDVDGNRVVSGTSLRGYIRRYQKGEKVYVTYIRDGRENQVEVQFDKAEEN